jgi:hypothetical protein
MDATFFDVPPDPRRSLSPRVEQEWSELMDQYASLLYLHGMTVKAQREELDAILHHFHEQTYEIQERMKNIYAKLREVHRNTLFRRASMTLPPILVRTSKRSTVVYEETSYPSTAPAPPKKWMFWAKAKQNSIACTSRTDSMTSQTN